jgi:hypothetical protein
MGLQINKTLTPKGMNAAIIPSGLVISYRPTFEPVRTVTTNPETQVNTYQLKHKLHVNFDVYMNKLAFETGSEKIQAGVEEFEAGFERFLTDAEFVSLSGANAFAIVEGWIIAWLESKIGSGNIVHIDFTI